MAFLSEAEVEQGLLDQLLSLGYTEAREEDIGPDGRHPERESHDEVILSRRLLTALARLNPHLPLEAHQDAARRLTQSELPVLLEENRRVHKLMTEGIDLEYLAGDGTLTARVGSLSADQERFMPWRTTTTDGRDIAPKGTPELATLIEGVLEKSRLLDLVRHFTVFGETGSGLVKILAGYHQFHAVKKAVQSTLRASASGEMLREDPESYGLPSVRQQTPGDRRAGVLWHTQGSGKSLLMAFYAGQLVKHPAMANPTLVILTDRNDLDDQLFATFSMCKDLLRQTPVQANSREELREHLNIP